MNQTINELKKSEILNESREDEDSSVNTLYETIDLSDICYLCLHYRDGKYGATLYHSDSRSIELINELEDNDFDSVEALLLQTEPNHVIISSKSDPKLIELLKHCANGNNMEVNDNTISGLESESETSEQIPEESRETITSLASDLLWKFEFEFNVHIISYKHFGFENAKNRILSINMSNDYQIRDEMQRILYISTFVDISDNNTFKSFGALLRFLDLKGVEFQMQTNPSNGPMAEVLSISRLSLKQLVAVERNTYESLQIFQQEWHPSAAKQGINQKEGLSLYGLFNCCASKIGANYLRKIFLLPTQETDILMDRLLAIEFFIEPNHHISRDILIDHLKHIKSVTALFNRLLTTATITISDLQLLYSNLLNALRIRDIVVQQITDLKIFRQIREQFTEEVDRLANVFSTVIDFERTVHSQSFEINFGVDEELDQTKTFFIHLPQLLERVAKEEVEAYGHILSDLNCAYIPQMGFLTSAQVVYEDAHPDQLNEELKFVVEAGHRYYFKTPKTAHLDSQFGDIHSEIVDRQVMIVNQLQELIVNKKYVFVSIVKCCAKLDALIAMSRTAHTYRYTKPNLTTDGSFEIIDGRHPLIEIMSNAFVPNDYMSGGPYKKAKLISGPNACGKSVYLKQNCIIVYLAHIGSYVPAFSATISIVDRIFTRIHTPESLTLRLSTFMADLKQMSNAIKSATNRSFVAVDEFGKGTQPIDGLALMAACVDHWLSKSFPHLIVSSHFHCLPSIINRYELIDCLTFEFVQSVNGLKYLFKLNGRTLQRKYGLTNST